MFLDNRITFYEQAWTYEGCISVYDTSADPRFGVTHSAYYDGTNGINNPNVFIPVRQCLTDEEYAMPNTLFGLTLSRKGQLDQNNEDLLL